MNLTKAQKKKIRDLVYLNVGTLILAIGVYFFKFINNFCTGGVSGISIVVSHLIPSVSTATMNMILNVVLLVLGLAIIGPGFSLRTAYSAVLSSAVTLLLEKVFPLAAPMTGQPFLELIFAVALPAVGSAMLFLADASSGGTDILAMILKKYTRLNIGSALVCVDCVVAVSACFIFNMETGLFSILGLLLKAFMVDYVMDSMETFKVFHIVTSNPEPICAFIMENLGHSATVTRGEGSYTKEERHVLMTVVNRSQALALQKFVRKTDPHSFMTITTSSHIIGKGFRGMSE
ncbi:MAG: YitT family protein [Clostridiales bacterium]|nr:YitT family protein [Clostridiales bacterium]